MIIFTDSDRRTVYYDRPRKINLSVGLIELENKEGGGFSTVLPISGLEHRKKHPTKAGVVVRSTPEEVEFLIKSDHGADYALIIPREFQEVINRNLFLLESADLLRNKVAA